VTEHDRQPFAELILGLGETYGEPVSDIRMEVYWRALEDLSFSSVYQAATIHARTTKFFPRPSELREAVNGPIEDRAEVAWMAVRSIVRRYGYWADPKEIQWPDEVTQHAALKLYGGWRALCEHLPASGPEMLGTAKLFKAHYAAVSRQAQREALPPTREEARNVLVDLKAKLEARGLPAGGL
jgi:hypothetical protein